MNTEDGNMSGHGQWSDAAQPPPPQRPPGRPVPPPPNIVPPPPQGYAPRPTQQPLGQRTTMLPSSSPTPVRGRRTVMTAIIAAGCALLVGLLMGVTLAGIAPTTNGDDAPAALKRVDSDEQTAQVETIRRLQAERDASADDFERVSAELADTENRLAETEELRVDAEAEAERLREEYDPQIQAARAAAVAEAAEAEAANAEAAAETARRQALSIRDRLNEDCAVVEPQQLQKDPDASTGQCFIVVAKVAQWDGATGPCGFLAPYDRIARTYSYEYEGESAVFVAAEPCDQLAGMDQDDVLKLWVTSSGTLTYDTKIGGSNTTVQFYIEDAELVRKE